MAVISVEVELQIHNRIHNHFSGSIPTPVIDSQPAANSFESSGTHPAVLIPFPCTAAKPASYCLESLASLSSNLLMPSCALHVPGELRGCVTAWRLVRGHLSDIMSCIYNQFSPPMPAHCPRTINSRSQIIFHLVWALSWETSLSFPSKHIQRYHDIKINYQNFAQHVYCIIIHSSTKSETSLMSVRGCSDQLRFI